MSLAVYLNVLPAPAPQSNQQSPAYGVKRPIGTTEAANGFIEFLPPNYGIGPVKAPLLLAFHGRGENGPGTAASLDQLRNNGITKLMHEGRWTQPFVVIAPQHDGGGCPSADEVHGLIEFAKTHYRIDERRIYLTGLSCGARGIADYFARYGTDEVAASVLIAGDLSPAWVTRECEIARRPLWIIHGQIDDIVRDTGDAATVARIQAECPHAAPLKYDPYPKIGHDAWTMAYATTATHDVFTWMLNQRRPSTGTAHSK